MIDVRFVPIADIRRLVVFARCSRAHGLSSDLNIASISTRATDKAAVAYIRPTATYCRSR